MTREQFDEAVARMRAVEGGTVTVTDWPQGGSGSDPYRYAQLIFRGSRAFERIAELALLAVGTDGHLSMTAHRDEQFVNLAVSRPLDDAEILAASRGLLPPCVEVA